MSIVYTKTLAVFFSVAFVVTLLSPSVTAQSKSVADLQREIAELTALITRLSSSQSSASVTSSGNSACPYVWSRNLVIGSRGEDVRQLQRFLNNDIATRIASSGAGSPANETSYYGPGTARAVSKFQEKYAARILTPVGLSSGTGSFYTSTRSHANALCVGGVRQTVGIPTVKSPVQVSGSGFVISEGKRPADAYAVAGAQRVPYTSFILTAGDRNVRVNGVKVRRVGLSSRDAFDSIALVDANGVQLGSARSINSRDEVNVGGGFDIVRNTSVVLTVVGNVVSDSTDAKGVAGLEVFEIDSDARMGGNLPIRGAAHVFSDSITLQNADITVTSRGAGVELGEAEEVGEFTINLTGSDSEEEDAYLRSITFEQKGSADPEDFKSAVLIVDGDRDKTYNFEVSGDRYTVVFPKTAILIEERNDIDLTIEIEAEDGSGEKIKFEIDEPSDVYVVGASYGYGLPVTLDGDTDTISANTYTISGGNVSGGGTSRVRGFTSSDYDVTYGRDKLLGTWEVEVEGEDITLEDLTFSVALTGVSGSDFVDADEDTVSLENVYLEVNGRKVLFSDDDIDFEADTTETAGKFTEVRGGTKIKTLPSKSIGAVAGTPAFEDDAPFAIAPVEVEFTGSFTVNADRNEDVVFALRGFLNDDWSNFDGADIQFTLVTVGEAEGVISEDDLNESFGGDDETEFNLPFHSVSIEGNIVDFELSSDGADDSQYVAGAEDVVFGTFTIDASDSVDSVDLDSVEFNLITSAGGKPQHIRSCILTEGGREVADSRDARSGTANSTEEIRFDFSSRYSVDTDDEVDLEIACNIATRAAADGVYSFEFGPEQEISYSLGREDFDTAGSAGNVSERVTISTRGDLTVSVDAPGNDGEIGLAVGNNGINNFNVIEIDVEAEEEDIRITGIYLDGITVAGDPATEITLGRILDEISVDLETGANVRTSGFETSKTASTNANPILSNYLFIDDINFTVDKNSRKTFNLSFDYKGIDEERKGISGNAGLIGATNLIIVFEGQDSSSNGFESVEIGSNMLEVLPFRTLPKITSSDKNGSLRSGTGQIIYEFEVEADEAEDLYIAELNFAINKSNDLTTLDNFRLEANGSKVELVGTPDVIADGTLAIQFTGSEEIRKSTTVKFTLKANIGGTITNDDSLVVDLKEDIGDNVTSDTARGIGGFVWSPNTFGNRGKIGLKDWYRGSGIWDSSDVEGWTFD